MIASNCGYLAQISFDLNIFNKFENCMEKLCFNYSDEIHVIGCAVRTFLEQPQLQSESLKMMER